MWCIAPMNQPFADAFDICKLYCAQILYKQDLSKSYVLISPLFLMKHFRGFEKRFCILWIIKTCLSWINKNGLVFIWNF